MAFNGIDYELEVLAVFGRLVTNTATLALVILPGGHLAANLGAWSMFTNLCTRVMVRFCCDGSTLARVSAAAAA